MKKEQLIESSFAAAIDRYAALGVQVNEVLEKLGKLQLSLHCWQTDDIAGFENQGGALTGGIQVTGNYPGKARTIGEVRADILEATRYIAGHHRLSLHETYGDFGGKKVDRDEVTPEHFASWIQWAKANNMKLDFNSTSFSHPKSGNLTLANPDDGIRNFWIEHTKRCRWIADEMGAAQYDPAMLNIWVHDGSKEVPANRLRYRRILEQSLDEIFKIDYKNMKDCIEAKLFGIGLESYTVGSYDFYLGYGAKKGKIVTLDTGHFHLTESIADKVSSLLLFTPEIMLHVSRPIRWDSDHVVILNDDLLDLSREIIRCDALDHVHVGLDYFDATINRIGAYVIGCRATQKAFLRALLEPSAQLLQYEDNDQWFERLALQEELKSLPWTAVWDMFCLTNNVPVGEDYISGIQTYERNVTSKRS
jgi:L-rhamnose isomerase